MILWGFSLFGSASVRQTVEDIATIRYTEPVIKPEIDSPSGQQLLAIPKPEVGIVLFGDKSARSADASADSSGDDSETREKEIDFRKRFMSIWWRATFSPFIWQKKEKVKAWGLKTLTKKRALERREWLDEQSRISPATKSLCQKSQSYEYAKKLATPRQEYQGKTFSIVSFSERLGLLCCLAFGSCWLYPGPGSLNNNKLAGS
jgi:hypothetical protein